MVRGWKTVEEDGKKKRLPVYATKGGFNTKREALDYCHELRAGKARPARPLTFADVYEAWEKGHKDKVSQHMLY